MRVADKTSESPSFAGKSPGDSQANLSGKNTGDSESFSHKTCWF